jgi:hypothetical protein
VCGDWRWKVGNDKMRGRRQAVVLLVEQRTTPLSTFRGPHEVGSRANRQEKSTKLPVNYYQLNNDGCEIAYKGGSFMLNGTLGRTGRTKAVLPDNASGYSKNRRLPFREAGTTEGSTTEEANDKPASCASSRTQVLTPHSRQWRNN